MQAILADSLVDGAHAVARAALPARGGWLVWIYPLRVPSRLVEEPDLTRFQAILVRSSAVSLAILATSGSVAWAQPVAEGKSSAPAPAATSNFSRLVDPALAEKLKLSDEQRIQIANLQTERTEALAKAAPDQRATVQTDYEQKLLALLSDDQKAELAKPAGAGADPKLRFSFRFQRWSDVLEWFAEQANLSLVIDAPPPGTFNYSDNRDYSVSEALDLLNGVLLTKGYTLIRRDRMLTVVNLADGVPEALVPRITLADLESRGRFEIVSMLFPVGKRDVEEVVKEIAPLLGPRGKSLPLPKTKQILVTDTAGVMRAINAVIESIPQPEKPRSEEQAEKPELVVYPLKTADPDAAVKVLEALLPTGRFVRDPKANQISAYATPTQQEAVKRVVEQLQAAAAPGEEQTRFEVYQLDDADPRQSLVTLQPLVPNARLSVDPGSKKLAAWGTKADHELLAKAVAQLGRGGGPLDDRQVEVYRLKKADPTAASVVLQNILPKARLSVDATSRSIIALANLADQKTIRATLDQLEPPQDGADGAEIRLYSLSTADPSSVMSVVQTLFPTAKLVLDTKNRRLAAWTRAADQESIKALIEQMDAEPPGGSKNELMVYPVTSADLSATITTLKTLAPEATLTADSKAGTIVAWARKGDHAKIASALERLQPDDPKTKPRIVAYEVGASDPTVLYPLIGSLVPTARVVPNAKNGTIAVWATAADHETIRAAIGEMTKNGPLDAAAKVVVYPLKAAEPATLVGMLQTLFPTARFTSDVKNRRLLVFGRAAEQEAIKAAIDEMDAELPGGSKNELKVYPVTSADLSATITALRSLAPDVTLTADTKAGTIVAWARKADQALIAGALEQLQPVDGKSKPHIVAYAVGASDPTVLYPMISTLVPTARVVPNAKNGTIAVWATAADHETIRAAIGEMTKDGPLDAAAKVVVYPLKAAEPASLVGMLQTLFPGSRFTFDVKNRRLLVFGRPAEQETIKTAIEQMDVQPADEAGRRLAVYPIVGADATATMTMLRTLVPQTTLTNDTRAGTILAWGPQSELDKIAPALEQMQAKGDPKLRSRIVSYSTAPSDPATLYPLVAALVPTARVVPNAKAGSIAVWATPDEHETIRAAIEEMTSKGTDANVPKVVVYTLKSTSAANLVSALTTAVPEARLGVSQNSRKLVAWARPADHETIRQALVELDTEETERSGAVLKAYVVTNADLSSLLSTLQTLFGSRREVRLSQDTRNNKIVALATPSQHEAIRGVIEEIERGSPLDARSQLEVHALRNADPESVMQVLTNLVTKNSRALLSVDAKAKTLIAVASEPQQATIRSTIERMQSMPRQLEVFQLELVEPLTAETAIEKLFAETAGGSGKSALAPSVESDVASQRLFVRGNAEQLAQIRDLLVKMGETNLVAARDGSVRVIHFAGDTKEALAEIQRVWPQLSKSPLRVVRPGEVPLRLRSKLPGGKAGEPKPAEPVPPATPPPAPPGDGQEPKDKHTRVDSRARPLEVKTAAQEDEPAPPAEETPAEEAPREEPTEPKPILVAPGDDKITIMSDDPEAIEQFEALLRALSPPAGAMGRDVMVYPLRSASSTTVAELLNRLFRKSGFGFSDSSVVIEADQRLNAIIVYGGRNDRTTIERLLKLLDSEDVPESLVANRPILIPVKNTSASRLERVISDIYKTQLTSGGVKQQIPVPSGATRDVAAVIQQINTAASGPMMTLGVDDTTNSIVVMAPGPLVREVKELVAELDEAALHDTSRGVRIVKLKSTNAMRVKEILDAVIRDATRRRSSSSGSVRP